MRRGRDGSIWKEDGKVVALNLGSDFCAEHEWGIKNIKRILGMKDLEIPSHRSATEKILEFLNLKKEPLTGIDLRSMSVDYEPVHNLESKGMKIQSGYGKSKKNHTVWGLAVIRDWMKERFQFENLRDLYYDPEREELVGFWSEDNFAILIEDKSVIEEFVEAFKTKDIAIWTGSSGPFRNGGLIVAIKSRLPEDFVKEMDESDKDQIALKKAAFSTGIYEKLEKAEKKFYALSPRWKDDTKTDVVFWLNPYDQRNNNHGWYVVEDLEEWIEGKGKIPKVKEKA